MAARSKTDNLAGWLYRVANNLALSHLRSKAAGYRHLKSYGRMQEMLSVYYLQAYNMRSNFCNHWKCLLVFNYCPYFVTK